VILHQSYAHHLPFEDNPGPYRRADRAHRSGLSGPSLLAFEPPVFCSFPSLCSARLHRGARQAFPGIRPRAWSAAGLALADARLAALLHGHFFGRTNTHSSLTASVSVLPGLGFSLSVDTYRVLYLAEVRKRAPDPRHWHAACGGVNAARFLSPLSSNLWCDSSTGLTKIIWHAFCQPRRCGAGWIATAYNRILARVIMTGAITPWLPVQGSRN